MERHELPFLSVAQLSRLIESREVSPVEVTQAYLDRIDALDFKFNAYLAVSRREALEAAREAEQAIGRGEYQGPMHGIPMAVKDQFWTKGSPHHRRHPHPGGFRARGRRHHHREPEAGRRRAAGQDQHDRVRHGGGFRAVQPSTQPLGPRTADRRLQRRLGRQRLPPSCAPHPWARTPAGRSGSRPPGAASSATAPPGDW